MRRLNSAALLMLVPTHLMLLVVIALPSIYVFWLSLNQSTYGSDLTFVGFDNYLTVLSSPYFWRSTLNTLIVVNAIVYVELILALAMAALFLGGVRYPRIMFAIVLMPYAISEVVGVLIWKIMLNPGSGVLARAIENLGFGMLNWSVSPPLALGVVTLISIWHHLPFTFLLIYAGMLAIPKSLYEASRIDGATSWQEFWRITLPLTIPAILISLIFRFVFAFRLFSEVWLLTGGGPARFTEVVALYLYQSAFKYGEFGTASATGWLMVIGSLLVASVYLWAMHRRMLKGND
ncbi:carbohydrate ABC transporter permease [Neorhizobium sp. DT-125]|uniref:carbohydrate ABC transporter permease n=1 Tax=Neorhizobium sp. DT-125 TaxID=3396163 RepID=UPI003F1A58D2